MEIKTTEFFKNIKSLPPEGTKDFEDLIDWETQKCVEGTTISGVYIPGWLYFHLNHWLIRIDHEDSVGNVHRIESLPILRDNEWIRSEHFEECRKQKKGYIEIGARQGGKSEMEASYTGYNALLFKNSQNIVVGSNSKDLDMLKDKIDFGMKSIWKGLYIPRLDKTWRGNQVRLGYKEPNGEDRIWSHIIIRNTDDGKNTEVTAGTTAKSFVYDEAGKAPWMASFEASRPAFSSDFGLRAIPMVVGCLTAGNKVFTKDGNLINIEDLQQSDGIIGFDKKINHVSLEDIIHINPPQKKECYKITTKKGLEIECSYDHPLLIKHRNRRQGNKRLTEFVDTENLEIGMFVSVPDIIPLTGSRSMENPYFIGALIGDGNYSGDRGIRFYNEDSEIWDYVDSIGKDYTIFNSYTTTKDRLYKEVRFRGGMKQLKELGIYGQAGPNKDLPNDIHLYREDDICQLVAGLFDTDGCVLPANKSYSSSIFITSSSEKLINSLKLLLIRLGIHSNKLYRKPDKRDRKIQSKNGYFELSINDSLSLLRFCDKIPLKIVRKKLALQKIKEISQKKTHKIDSQYPGLRFERIVKIEKVGEKPVYNLTTSNTHTYLANGIVTHNTGGSFDKGEDAERVFYNPEANGFLGVEDPISGVKTGLFISGIYRREFKYDTTLANFLIEKRGINIPEDSELHLIPMKVADEEKALKAIHAERELKKKDSDQAEYLKVVMYSPLTPEECFMRNKVSVFNTEAAKAQKQRIINNNLVGSNIFLHHDGEKIAFEYTEKRPISRFPHSPNDDLDAPIQVWEFPPLNPPHGLFVAGVDPFSQTNSKYSKSLGAIYIFKRMSNVLDETKYQYRFVASYVARPNEIDKFNEQCRLLIKWYNAIALCENDVMLFIEYMKSKGDAHYLQTQPQWLESIHSTSTVKRGYGIHSTPQIIAHRDGHLKNYLEEVLHVEKDDQGSIIKEVTGVSTIMDPMLLEEIIKYDPNDKDWNGDRIVAAGLAITQAKHMDPIVGMVGKYNDKFESYFNRKKKGSSLFHESRSSLTRKDPLKKLFK